MDIVADVDSLRLMFPKLASIKEERGHLHLSFLNLAAELKFSVAIPLGEPQSLQPLPPRHSLLGALPSFMQRLNTETAKAAGRGRKKLHVTTHVRSTLAPVPVMM